MNTIPKHILWVLDTLHKEGKEAYIVGGCVRDMIMHRPIHDFDITTNALPQQTMLIFQKENCKVIPTGIRHGTVTVLVHDDPVEITTYRIEEAYLDHRTPSKVSFSNQLYEDLKRRDFTINAIAYDPNKGFIDPFHGMQDLHDQIIRCVGNSEERFEEDALRILRALRFQATLHFSLDEAAHQAIRNKAHLLTYISKERIRDEFNKLLLGNMPNTLQILRDCGVLTYILPGFDQMYDHPQNNPWHIYDVFTHTDIALNYTEHDPLWNKLTIIFHDTGKIQAEVFDEEGIAHYPKHARYSEEIAIKMMKDLKYEKRSIERVAIMIRYHDYHLRNEERSLRRFLAKVDNDLDLALQIQAVQQADDMAKNPAYVKQQIDERKIIIQKLIEIHKKNDCLQKKDMHINGHDLMALGIQGPAIKDMLDQLFQLILNDPSCNDHDFLIKEAVKRKKNK